MVHCTMYTKYVVEICCTFYKVLLMFTVSEYMYTIPHSPHPTFIYCHVKNKLFSWQFIILLLYSTLLLFFLFFLFFSFFFSFFFFLCFIFFLFSWIWTELIHYLAG